MLRWSPLERNHPDVVGAAAVSDGGLEDVVAVEVLGLGEVGGVRQVGDVPGTEVTLRLALRPHQEPLEGCPASYRDSGISTPLYTHNHHHFLSSPEVGLRAHLFLVHHNFNRRLTLNTKLVYSGILMFHLNQDIRVYQLKGVSDVSMTMSSPIPFSVETL